MQLPIHGPKESDTEPPSPTPLSTILASLDLANHSMPFQQINGRQEALAVQTIFIKLFRNNEVATRTTPSATATSAEVATTVLRCSSGMFCHIPTQLQI